MTPAYLAPIFIYLSLIINPSELPWSVFYLITFPNLTEEAPLAGKLKGLIKTFKMIKKSASDNRRITIDKKIEAVVYSIQVKSNIKASEKYGVSE